MRKNYATGARWEDLVGYSRAVRIGNVIEVSGTVAIADGKPYAVGDPYNQTRRILEIIESALDQLGSSHEDVIRTRMYVTNIERDWSEIGKAHHEVYAGIKPATSMVEVSRFISPEFLVEIEVTAVVN